MGTEPKNKSHNTRISKFIALSESRPGR